MSTSEQSSMVLSMRWEKVSQSAGPGKRWGHTCNAMKGGRFIYLFGGYSEDKLGQTNQVHVFDTVNMLWSEVVMRGTPPSPRNSHSCTAVEDNLYVFGGTDGSKQLNDLHILNTSSHTWLSPTLWGNGPEAREGHSAALIGKRLFIFGGCGKFENREVHYNDLYILNIDTFSWKRVVPSGTPPSKRDSHTCSSWREKIIIIGGEDSNSRCLSDVHILDTDTLTWYKLDTTGHLLPPRGGHTTVSFGNKLFVFGGFSDEQNLYNDVHVLDLEKSAWKKVVPVGEGPSGRFSVAGQCLDPQMTGALVFICGCSKRLEALNDMYYLHTGLSREADRDKRRNEKLSLRKLLKLKCQDQHVISPASGLKQDATIYQASNSPGRQKFCLTKHQDSLGKRTFQANVTRSGRDPSIYDMETIIDGKTFHGLVFANRPSSASTITGISDRRTSDAVDVNGNPNSEVDSGISVEHCDFKLVDVAVREEKAGEAHGEFGDLEIEIQEVDKEEVSASVNKTSEAVLQVEVAPCGITNPASPESLVEAEILGSLVVEPVMESQNDAGDNVQTPSLLDTEMFDDDAAVENQNAPLN